MNSPSFHKSGKRVAQDNWFAVPAEEVQDGHITGIRVMREILDSLKTSGGYGRSGNVVFWRFIQDLGKAMEESRGIRSRRHAAWKTAVLIEEALEFFANKANYAQWLQAKLVESEKDKVYWDAHQATEKADFVRRMKDARAAKALNGHKDVHSKRTTTKSAVASVATYQQRCTE